MRRNKDKMENKKKLRYFSVIGMMCRGCGCSDMVCQSHMECVLYLCGIAHQPVCLCLYFYPGDDNCTFGHGISAPGILLAVLGLTMCTCSFTVLCFTLIITGKDRQRKVQEQK